MTWYTDRGVTQLDLASKVTGLGGVTALWGGSQAAFAAEIEANGLDPAKTYAITPSLHLPGVAGFVQRWIARGIAGAAGPAVRSWPSAIAGGTPLAKDNRPSTPVIAVESGLRLLKMPSAVDSGYSYTMMTGDAPAAGPFTAAVITRVRGNGAFMFHHRGVQMGASNVNKAVLGSGQGSGGSGSGQAEATVPTVSEVNLYIITSDGAGNVTLKGNNSAPVSGAVTPSVDTATKISATKDYVEIVIWPSVLTPSQQSDIYTALKAAYPSLP